MTPTQFDDPRATWKLASYEKPERRKQPAERREEPKRAVLGERRKGERRTLKSLLRL